MSETSMHEKPPRLYRGTDDAARKQERRSKLIQAGIQTFGTQGYANTKVKDVCVAAKLTERYFYESFTDREALLGAVYDTSAEAMGAAFAAAVAEGDTTGLAILKHYFAFVRDEPKMAQVLFFEIVGVSPAMDTKYRNGIGAMGAFLASEFRYPQPNLYSGLGAAGALIYMAATWVLSAFEEPIESVIAQAHAYVANASVCARPGLVT
jgi:AcrR family transcriptional regulator